MLFNYSLVFKFSLLCFRGVSLNMGHIFQARFFFFVSIYIYIIIWPAYNVVRFLRFQIAIQMNKYQLDKMLPICPHVAKTNMLTNIKIHAKGGTKFYKSQNHRTFLPFPFPIIPFPFLLCT